MREAVKACNRVCIIVAAVTAEQTCGARNQSNTPSERRCLFDQCRSRYHPQALLASSKWSLYHNCAHVEKTWISHQDSVEMGQRTKRPAATLMKRNQAICTHNRNICRSSHRPKTTSPTSWCDSVHKFSHLFSALFLDILLVEHADSVHGLHHKSPVDYASPANARLLQWSTRGVFVPLSATYRSE